MPHIERKPLRPPPPVVRDDDQNDNRAMNNLAKAINALVESGEAQFEWFKSHLNCATKQDLKETEKRIMSAISDFLTKQEAFNTRQSGAIDSVVASVDGLTADVAELNRLIKDLQDSSGSVTPEDQERIDKLQTAGEAISTKLEGASTALQALDAATPPRVPPAGGGN